MTATAETKIQNVPVKQPAKIAKKPATEKKAKVPKDKKPKTAKTASHPPYFQMIKEALVALKEKNGSSPHAIGKYMEEKHKSVLPENFRKMLALQLKNSAAKGKLTKVKASFKLSDSGKKEKAVAVKKPAGKKVKETKSKKPAAVVAAAPAAKGSKKAVKKGVKPVKKIKKTPVKAKQPKSIKSPVVKRAKKATA